MVENNSKEREFQFRPTKPPARTERVVLTSAFKIIMHHARISGKRVRRSSGLGRGRSARGAIARSVGERHLRKERDNRPMEDS